MNIIIRLMKRYYEWKLLRDIKKIHGKIEEVFENVDLIFSEVYGDCDSFIYDFSRYESDNLVLMVMTKFDNKLKDQMARIGYEPAQTLYRFADGAHFWWEGLVN